MLGQCDNPGRHFAYGKTDEVPGDGAEGVLIYILIRPLFLDIFVLLLRPIRKSNSAPWPRTPWR